MLPIAAHLPDKLHPRRPPRGVVARRCFFFAPILSSGSHEELEGSLECRSGEKESEPGLCGWVLEIRGHETTERGAEEDHAVVGGEEDVGVCEGVLLEDGLLGLNGL